jgi:hypothetical protein
MSHRISCYTLFDITKTGVINRGRPRDDVEDTENWFIKRNTQCNFDTILQVISLRSQPEVVLEPKIIEVIIDKNSNFGTKYQDNKKHIVWMFDFEVQHSSVFEDNVSELGALYKDCDGVPMLKSGKEIKNLDEQLSIDNIKKNIYFVKY